MSSITVRPKLPSDSKALWLLEDVWNETNTPVPMPKKKLEEFELEIADREMLVAHNEQGNVIGMVSYHLISTLPAHCKQWMLGISVSPEAQGQGVGRHLMEAIIQLAKQKGIAKLSLRVMGTNPGAIAFYKRLGFVQEAHFQREFWINHTWVDDFQFAYYI